MEPNRAAASPVLLLLTLFMAGLSLGTVYAQDDAGVVSYRQKLMESLGAHMGSIGDMLKYKLPYDKKHVATHADNISRISALIGEAFEKEAGVGTTDAKPEIWGEWDKFIAAANALEQAGAALSQAAQGGEMGALMPQVKAVGDACKGCHEPFRKPQ